MVNAIISLPTAEEQELATEVLHRLGVRWHAVHASLKDNPIRGKGDYAVRINNGVLTSGSVSYYKSDVGSRHHRNSVPSHLFCCTLQDYLVEIGEIDPPDDINTLPDIATII